MVKGSGRRVWEGFLYYEKLVLLLFVSREGDKERERVCVCVESSVICS